jgi:hypothetical protein
MAAFGHLFLGKLWHIYGGRAEAASGSEGRHGG